MLTVRRVLSVPFRILGWVLFLAALAAGGRDLWLAATGGDEVTFTRLGEAWFALAPGSLNLAQAIVQRYVHPALWDPGVAFLLNLPAWLSLALLAALTLLIAQIIYRPGLANRRRRR